MSESQEANSVFEIPTPKHQHAERMVDKFVDSPVAEV